MKIIIIINLALVFSIKVFSQNNILVNFINTTNTVAAGSTIYTTTTAENTSEIILDIKNISNSTKSYLVKRYDIILNSVNSTTAVARFCFAGNCYLAGTLISPPLTLTPGQSASSIQGDNQVLSCDFDEAAAIGYSYIKYTFINTINSSDSLQFSIKYNDPNAPLTIMETSKNLDAFNFSPNPVSDELTFKIKATKNDKSILNIYNGIGAITIKKEFYLTEGENVFQINTSELPVGIYFASLKINNSTFTKKLIIK